jgi:hypothetical protein
MARSTSSGVADMKAGSSGVPLPGCRERPQDSVPFERENPMKDVP